jgi:hypothetical protein
MNQVQRVVIPPDCMAVTVQMRSAQIVTGGVVQPRPIVSVCRPD